MPSFDRLIELGAGDANASAHEISIVPASEGGPADNVNITTAPYILYKSAEDYTALKVSELTQAGVFGFATPPSTGDTPGPADDVFIQWESNRLRHFVQFSTARFQNAAYLAVVIPNNGFLPTGSGGIATLYLLNPTAPQAVFSFAFAAAGEFATVGTPPAKRYVFALSNFQYLFDEDPVEFRNIDDNAKLRLELAFGGSLTQYWALLASEEAVDVAAAVGDSSQLTMVRTYLMRHNELATPFGVVVDDTIEWNITSVERIGRNRYMNVHCQRVITGAFSNA